MDKLDKPINISITSGTIMRVVLFGLLFASLYFFWDILLVLLTAVVLASSVEPATKWFGKLHVPRLPAVIIIYILVALFFSMVLYIFVPPILDEAIGFFNNLPDYLNSDKLFSLTAGEGPSFLSPSLQELSRNFSVPDVINNLRVAVSGVSGGIIKVISQVFGGFLSFILIVVLSFYLSVQKDGIANFLKIIVPVKSQKYVIDLWNRSQYKIGLWMQGQLLLAVIIGVLVYLLLTILSVKYDIRYALLLSVLAAIFELVPVFGPVLAAIPAVIIGFIDGGVSLGVLIGGGYVIIQQFENQLLYPLVVRKVVGVPPLVVILALIMGAKIAGFLGILLSVPIAAAVLEYLHDVQKQKHFEELEFAKNNKPI